MVKRAISFALLVSNAKYWAELNSTCAGFSAMKMPKPEPNAPNSIHTPNQSNNSNGWALSASSSSAPLLSCSAGWPDNSNGDTAAGRRRRVRRRVASASFFFQFNFWSRKGMAKKIDTLVSSRLFQLGRDLEVTNVCEAMTRMG